jgi:hypothetical protein
MYTHTHIYIGEGGAKRGNRRWQCRCMLIDLRLPLFIIIIHATGFARTMNGAYLHTYLPTHRIALSHSRWQS